MALKKKVIVGIFIGFVVLLIIAGAFLYAQTKSTTREAFLSVESGTAQVFDGSEWIDASDGQLLEVSSRVRTLEDSLASVVLHESIIVNLEPMSEVALDDLSQEYPKVSLDAGEVWSKFTGLLGVQNFDVVTPTAVATVRGTEFGVSFDSVTQVLVAEGVVGVSSNGESVEVRALEVARQLADGSLLVEALTEVEIAMLNERRGRVLEQLKRVRADEVDKNKVLLAVAKRQGVSREKISSTLADIDAGVEDENRIAGYVPVETESVEKILGLNRVIREQLADLADLE